jgi:hypothetical protein
MAKRILATVAGALAILEAVSASGLAIRASEDFQNPAVGFWPTILGETIVCTAAFVGFGIGIRFLYFGWKGHDNQKPVWMRPTLITLGSFFPGFILSLPLAFLGVTHISKSADLGSAHQPGRQLDFVLGVRWFSC